MYPFHTLPQMKYFISDPSFCLFSLSLYGNHQIDCQTLWDNIYWAAGSNYLERRMSDDAGGVFSFSYNHQLFGWTHLSVQVLRTWCAEDLSHNWSKVSCPLDSVQSWNHWNLATNAHQMLKTPEMSAWPRCKMMPDIYQFSPRTSLFGSTFLHQKKIFATNRLGDKTLLVVIYVEVRKITHWTEWKLVCMITQSVWYYI